MRVAPGLANRLLCVVVTEMNRRSAMLMMGFGLVAAPALTVPRAQRHSAAATRRAARWSELHLPG